MNRPETLLPLPHLSYHILLAVAEGPLHGWSIIRWIEAAQAGPVPSTGSLYLAMLRLERQGLLEQAPAPAAEGEAAEPHAERRRYYRLTASGRDALRLETLRLARLLEIAEQRHVFAPPVPRSAGGSGP